MTILSFEFSRSCRKLMNAIVIECYRCTMPKEVVFNISMTLSISGTKKVSIKQNVRFAVENR